MSKKKFNVPYNEVNSINKTEFISKFENLIKNNKNLNEKLNLNIKNLSNTIKENNLEEDELSKTLISMKNIYHNRDDYDNYLIAKSAGNAYALDNKLFIEALVGIISSDKLLTLLGEQLSENKSNYYYKSSLRKINLEQIPNTIEIRNIKSKLI